MKKGHSKSRLLMDLRAQWNALKKSAKVAAFDGLQCTDARRNGKEKKAATAFSVVWVMFVVLVYFVCDLCIEKFFFDHLHALGFEYRAPNELVSPVVLVVALADLPVVYVDCVSFI